MTDPSSILQSEEDIKTTYDRYHTIAKDIESHEFKEGEVGHLVSNKWYSRFKRAAKQNNNDFKLPINNDHLFNENKKIKQCIIYKRDYVVVSDKAWRLLSKWFEIAGPSEDVLSVKDPANQKIILDVVPYSYIIYYRNPIEDQVNLSKQVFISKYAKVGDLKLKALKECGLYKEGEASDESRLRDYFNQTSRQVLEDDNTLLSYNLTFEPELYLEKKDSQHRWPEIKKTGYVPIRKNSQSSNGMCGIINLHQCKCYQIAIIQSLGHCRPFVDLITDEKFDNITKNTDIEILKQFRSLIKRMWNNESGRPLELMQFNTALSKKENTHVFAQFIQNDAHEFLINIFDNLIGQTSPDPNVFNTEICVLDNSDGTTTNDQKTAEKNWNKLIKANQSPIYPLFYFLSTERYECFNCHNISTTFVQSWDIDIPFMTLYKKQQNIVWIPYSSDNQPLRFIIKIDNESESYNEYKNKINDTLKKNNISIEDDPNSTVAFAYQPNLDQSGAKNANLVSSSSSTIINFRPEFVFTDAKKVKDDLYAFEIPDKNKSYFLVTFSVFNFDLNLINAFICQFENEESEEEAKRIAIAHLKKTLFANEFKVEDLTNNNDDTIFKDVSISGSLVQNDRYQFLYNLTVNVTIECPLNTQTRRLRDIQVLPEFDLADILKERSMANMFDSKRFCEHCKENTQMSVSYQFCNMPEILIIYFGLFTLQSGHYERIKVKITFPETLLMKDCMIESKKDIETKYRLISVVVHEGPSPVSGHYYCYSYHDKRKEWLHCNDALVTSCNLSRVLQAQPFLLFYQRIEE